MLKRLTAVLTALLLMIFLPAAARAADSDLRICLRSDTGTPVSGIQVEVLQIAAGQGASAVVAADFFAVCPGAETLTASDSAAWAQTLYQHVLDQSLSGQTARSDDRGEAVFSGLENGLYLVFERGGQPVAFLPYLICMSDTGLTSAPKLEESGSRCLTVSKVWDDGSDADGLRPAMVTVTLLRNGTALRSVSLSDVNGWQHTFSHLPDTGVYEVRETAVEGYISSCLPTGDGFQIINRHQNSAPDAVSAQVQKVWDDAENTAGTRPAHITVQLVENGTAVKTAVLSESNHWMVSFAGLRADGVYSVWELPVDGYAASYSGSAAEGFRITNRYTGGSAVSPDEPQAPAPTIPQTGARLYVVYSLFAAGMGLTLLGIAVLRWGRGKS